jgi:hypothetical protein
MREVRSIIRLNNGAGFSFEDAWQGNRDEYELRRLLADLVSYEWIVNDAADHWSLTAKAHELRTRSRGKLTRARG